MDKIQKIWQFILSNKIIFALLLIYIAFHSFFEKHITILLVDTFLSYLETSWYNDLFAIFVFGVFLFNFRKSINRNCYPSNQLLALSIVFFLVVGYYRFFSNVWVFTPMFIWDKIKYADLTLIFCLSNITLRIVHKQKQYEYDNTKGFLFDTPIQTEEEDKLNRNNLAKTLVEKITNTVSIDAAFAIGVCSEWGQGKTSFLRLIENNLPASSEKSRIVVRFNTWLNNDERSIINSFFDELSKALKPLNKELSQDLIEYAKVLNTTKSSFTENLLYRFNINHSNSLRTRFDTINEKIKKSGKQIIVFIDDLDRLYEKEIVEILRLIRNSANFANTVFIVAYDRNYVVSALKQANEYRANFYLEKIFQLEIVLPNFEKYIVAKELKRVIEPFLTDEDKIIFNNLLKVKLGDNQFNYSMLSNIRDINRFANSFRLSYEELKGEINLMDLLNLELLRIKYLGVYDLLSKKHNLFLENEKMYDTKFYLCLRSRKDESDPKKKLDKTALEEHLNTHYTEAGIQRNQILEVIKYVNNIFPCNHYGLLSLEQEKGLFSITNAAAIDRYFHYSLLNSNLSEIEFSKYRQKSEIEFQIKITEWINSGLENELSCRLERIKFFANKEDYEKIINAIFFFASTPTTDNRVVGFDNDSLLSMLTDERIKVFYLNDEFKIFIKELFNRQKSPYLFASMFISHIFRVNAFGWNFVLDKDELINQKQNYFKQYAEATKTITKEFFWLYDLCKYMEWFENGNNSRSPKDIPPSEEAKNIFKQCAKKLIDNFLKNIITVNVNVNTDEQKKYYSVASVVRNVWSDWDNFEKFLLEFDEKQVPTLREFKNFFDECKKVNFERSIEFNFEEIDLTDALLFNY